MPSRAATFHGLDAVHIRLATPQDDIGYLTELLHRAYARLGQMGLRFMAVDQDETTTRKRMASGECYLAIANDRLVGTVTYRPSHLTKGSPWLDRPEVASLTQLAVEPALQGAGLGAKLMRWAEAKAAAGGAQEIALDTAEPAEHLRSWYASRGYRHIEFAQWAHSNYRSVIMSRSLA